MGRGKANFFVYGQICVGKRGKVLFRGGTKLTFLFMDQFMWDKGESCLKLSINSNF